MTQALAGNELKVTEPPKPNRPPSNILPLNFDLLGIESIKKELQKLSATNQELLKAFQDRPELPPAKPKEFGSSGNIVLPAGAEDLAKYKKENEQLRKLVADLEVKLRADAPTAVRELQEEFEQILDEKTETIRTLHMQNQELQAALANSGGSGSGASPEKLDAKQEELNRLEQQLRAHEEELNGKAREMEMAMAKERADVARQRADLQRLQTDVQREIELAGRDPGLRERLVSLQRRPRSANSLPDVGRPRSSAALPDVGRPRSGAALPDPARRPGTAGALESQADPNAAAQEKAGLLRRIFGG
jgi:hypothetical protein